MYDSVCCWVSCGVFAFGLLQSEVVSCDRITSDQLRAHQRRHGEADDLNAAVIVTLRLKVLMLAGMTPRHGSCTVPAARSHVTDWSLPTWTTGTCPKLDMTQKYKVKEKCTVVVSLYLGMLRKSRHCNFISWTLAVRSVPSHWRENEHTQAQGLICQTHWTHRNVVSSLCEQNSFYIADVFEKRPFTCTVHTHNRVNIL